MAFFESFARGFLGASAEIGRAELEQESAIKKAAATAKINKKHKAELLEQEYEIKQKNKLAEMEREFELEQKQAAYDDYRRSTYRAGGVPVPLSEWASGETTREGLTSELDRMAQPQDQYMKELQAMSPVESTEPLSASTMPVVDLDQPTPMPQETPEVAVNPRLQKLRQEYEELQRIPSSLKDSNDTRRESDLFKAIQDIETAEAERTQAKKTRSFERSIQGRFFPDQIEGFNQAVQDPINSVYGLSEDALANAGNEETFLKSKTDPASITGSKETLATIGNKRQSVSEIRRILGKIETGGLSGWVQSNQTIGDFLRATMLPAEYSNFARQTNQSTLQSKFDDFGNQLLSGPQSDRDIKLQQGTTIGIGVPMKSNLEWVNFMDTSLQRAEAYYEAKDKFVQTFSQGNLPAFDAAWKDYANTFPLSATYTNAKTGEEVPAFAIKDKDGVPFIPGFAEYRALKAIYPEASPEEIKRTWHTKLSIEDKKEIMKVAND
jgi:hypothetical protein